MQYVRDGTEHFEESYTLSDYMKNLSPMPYPCSHFYFDIKFGDRLYSKEKREPGLFSFEYNLSPKLISK